MAFRRCLLRRGNLTHQKPNPSFTYLLHTHHDDNNPKPSSSSITNFIQTRSFLNASTTSLRHTMFSNKFLSPFSGNTFCRNMSTVNQGSDNINIITDVLNETTVDAVASHSPLLSEVAIAAADSALPVKALQYFIDSVHSYTGLNWWVAIVLTTLFIRTAIIPLSINQLKATSRLSLIRPHLEEIQQNVKDKGMDPTVIAEGNKQMKKLFKEYKVTPFTPMKGLLIQGPIFISFFLAISNMAEKVPSFKHGGASWFIDLTTPDALYIFPALTALSFLITVETNMQEGLEGNPMAGTMKNVSRGLAVLTIPFTMGFPKAIFCYWVTSNLFSLMYGLALKVPAVKKTLGVPEVPAAESTSAPQSPFSIFPALKQATSTTNGPSSLPVEPSKHSNKKISSSSSSTVISQRLRSLEKQVKGRKKNSKR